MYRKNQSLFGVNFWCFFYGIIALNSLLATSVYADGSSSPHPQGNPVPWLSNERVIVMLELVFSSDRHKRLYSSTYYDENSQDGFLGAFNPDASYYYDEAQEYFIEDASDYFGELGVDARKARWQGRFLNWLAMTHHDYQRLLILGEAANKQELFEFNSAALPVALFDGNSRKHSPVPNGSRITLQNGVLRYQDKSVRLRVKQPRYHQGLIDFLSDEDKLFVYGIRSDKSKFSFIVGEGQHLDTLVKRKYANKPNEFYSRFATARQDALENALRHIARKTKPNLSDELVCQRYVLLSLLPKNDRELDFPTSAFTEDCQQTLRGEQALSVIDDAIDYLHIEVLKEAIFSELYAQRVAPSPRVGYVKSQSFASGKSIAYQTLVSYEKQGKSYAWNGQLRAFWLSAEERVKGDDNDTLWHSQAPKKFPVIKTHLGQQEFTLDTRMLYDQKNRDAIFDFRSNALQDDFLETLQSQSTILAEPVVVGPPSKVSPGSSVDKSYNRFVERYQNRRTRLFVQSHHGLLHAVNGGWFDPQKEDLLEGPANNRRWSLGEKMWTFLPQAYQKMQADLFLQRLDNIHKRPIEHENVVLQPLYVFDAQVFGDDGIRGQRNSHLQTHPEGWGTLLLVGVGLDTHAYLLFDITDAEQAPLLIADIRSDHLTKADSLSSVLSLKTDEDKTDWYLALGGNQDETSEVKNADDSAGILFVDLKHLGKSSPKSQTFLPIENVNQINGISVADWNEDGLSDALYINASNIKSMLGATFKMVTGSSISEWQEEKLLEVNSILQGRPQLSLDERGQAWVYVQAGNIDKNQQVNSSPKLFGFKDLSLSDRRVSETITKTLRENDLLNVSRINVNAQGGSLSGTWTLSPALLENTVYQLHKRMQIEPGTKFYVPGWVRELPKEFLLEGDMLLAHGQLLQRTAQHHYEQCRLDDLGALYQLKYTTGTPWFNQSYLNQRSTKNIIIDPDDFSKTSILSKGVILHLNEQQTGLLNFSDDNDVQEIHDYFDDIKTGIFSWREL